jgi:cell division protein FtsW (lipid II flippase)
MSDRLSRFHRILLWLMILQGTLGVVFLAAPDRILDATRVIAPIEVNVLIRVAGAFVVGTALIAWFALRSNSWAETRLFTWFVATAYLMIVIVRTAAIATGTAGGRWQAGIIELCIGLGFGWESVRRARDSHQPRQTSRPVRPSETPVP